MASSGFGGLSSQSSTTTLSYITPPPDLSNVPADIIVPFKNLLKKDSITKTRASEDILNYVKDKASKEQKLESSVLDAWVGPKIPS